MFFKNLAPLSMEMIVIQIVIKAWLSVLTQRAEYLFDLFRNNSQVLESIYYK